MILDAIKFTNSLFLDNFTKFFIVVFPHICNSIFGVLSFWFCTWK